MTIIKGLSVGLGLLLLSGCGSGTVDGYTNAGGGYQWKIDSSAPDCSGTCRNIKVIADADCQKLEISVGVYDLEDTDYVIGVYYDFANDVKAGVPASVTLISGMRTGSLTPFDFECQDM